MFLILSGEGSADIGIEDDAIGPMTKIVDDSPNSLKQQLEDYLGESGTRMLLNDKIDAGEIDIDRMTDLHSVEAFKDRLNEVLDLLGCPRSKEQSL